MTAERGRCYYCGQPCKGKTCGYCRDLKALDPWLDPRRSVNYTPRVGERVNSQ